MYMFSIIKLALGLNSFHFVLFLIQNDYNNTHKHPAGMSFQDSCCKNVICARIWYVS